MRVSKRAAWRMIAIATVIACSGALAACSAGAEKPIRATSGPDLVKAAKAEGSVSIASTDTEEELAKLAEQFKKKYGITVNYVSTTSTKLVRQVEAGLAGGNLQYDVVIHTLTSAWRDWAKKGVLAPVDVPNEGDIIPELRSGKNLWYPKRAEPIGIAYNKSRLAKDKVPDSWDDLLTSGSAKSVLALSDPNSTGTATNLMTVMSKEKPEYYEQLAKKYPKRLVADSSFTILQMVLRGEADLAVPGAEGFVLQLKHKGEPLGIVFPKGLKDDAVVMQANFIGALAKAEHPNAAALLVQYVLSRDYQDMQVKVSQSRSVLKDGPLPDNGQDLSDRKIVMADPAYLDKHASELRSRFTKLFH